MPVIVFCDGLCEPVNPGGTATYGWVAYRDGQKIAEECAVVCVGSGATNNVAEYAAIIAALRWLSDNAYASEKTELRSDSQLCINQLQGQWDVNSPRLMLLHKEALSLSKRFPRINFRWIRREQNKVADALSRKAYTEGQTNQQSSQLRRDKAQDIASKLQAIGNGRYRYKSPSSGTTYIINTAEQTCTCPDYTTRRQSRAGQCKHLLATEIVAATIKMEGGT
ncbi:MAG: Ribonuclease H [Syntrophomonadaceae bacterium]|nr:Ribonuclease H [Bacillota bacterium]